MKPEYPEVLRGCSAHFKLEFYKKGEAILKIGDISKQFYLSIEGSIGIFKPEVKAKDKKPLTRKKSLRYVDFIYLLHSERVYFN